MTPPHGRRRGITLFHCLTFLVVVTFLSGASYRVVRMGNGQVFQSHWGRTAEALADGALEMALAELENGGSETNLDAILSTGVASAEIRRGSSENSYRIVFQGTTPRQDRIRAVRAYEADVYKDPSGNYQVASIRRLSERLETPPGG